MATAVNTFIEAVLWLRRLDAGLSSRRPVLYTKAMNGAFLRDKVVFGQGFF